ncbi:uncharacterized protein LOC143191092 [Rhynchophorus ferrugineus]|uniref:uncharacterized protein LOC143191092 n=1 Tax=Rhynchophorus ferrugineus TaxID=354439 RepID=UPI003FCE6CB1
MKTEDEYPYFVKNLQKFINEHFLKPKIKRSESWKTPNQVDQVLEEEYETLLHEIDYLTGGKSCYLNFKNECYRNVSSDEIVKTISNHSWKVLENYLKHNIKEKSFDSRKDIVNYITEIVVSGPKCNNKLCTCKPLKISKQTNVENNDISKNGKKVQTISHVNEKGIVAVPNTTAKLNQISEELLPPKKSVVNAEIQTEDYLHNINCTCGKCPLINTTISTKTSKKEKDIEPEIDTYPSCLGISISELEKICVPRETELSDELCDNNKISICTSTKEDCSCDIFDVSQTPGHGLIFTNSDTGKKIKGNKKRSKSKKKEKGGLSSTESARTSEQEYLSSLNNGKSNEFNMSESESSSKKGKKKKKKTDSKSDSSIKPRKKKLKSNKQPTGCFVRIRKRKTDEESQKYVGNQRSIQTLPIKTQDQKEQAYHCCDYGTKAVKLSTNSEVAIQVSTSSLRANIPKNIKPGKYVFVPDNKFEDTQKKYDCSNECGINEDPRNVIHCNKCGRKKADCATGCRNTIVFPMTGSNKTLSTGEAESLRMVIKMQSKDTNRQLDSILSELTYQKNELRRLNEAYHLMKENIHEIKISEYCPGLQKLKSFNKKPCGCVARECRTLNKPNRPISEQNYNGAQGKRFGPPNTSVVINLCEFCDSGEGGDAICKATCLSSESCEEKRRKFLLNKSKKIDVIPSTSKSNGIVKKTSGIRESKSVSTIYQKKNEMSNKETEDSSVENIPKTKNTETSNSSKILLWLKRSWISIKHKSNECKTKMQERKKKEQKESKCKTKNIITGLWKMARKN